MGELFIYPGNAPAPVNGGHGLRVENTAGAVVYYGDSDRVSPAVYTGLIAAGDGATLYGTQYLLVARTDGRARLEVAEIEDVGGSDGAVDLSNYVTADQLATALTGITASTPLGRRSLGAQTLSGAVTYQTRTTDVVLSVDLALQGNATVSFSPLFSGVTFVVKCTQAGAGSYSVSFPQLRGTQPTFASPVGAVTVVLLTCPDGSNLYAPNSQSQALAATVTDDASSAAQTGT